MKTYTLAFLTLAAVAVATAATDNEPTMTKSEYLHLLRGKFKALVENKKRQYVDTDTCYAITCGDRGDYCYHNNVTCRGFLGCANDTCEYSKAGDRCEYDYNCFGSNLYCDRNRCREYAAPGSICANDNDCESDRYSLYCNVLDSDKSPLGFCKETIYIQKNIGEECDYASQWRGYEYCEYGAAYCTADELNRIGVCKALPQNLNDPCEPEHGCNFNNNLYCSADSKTCQYLPKEGQMCADWDCFPGFYCDGTFCRKRKDINETCSDYDECVEDLNCLYSHIKDKRICTYELLLEGEWCPDKNSYYSQPMCIEGLECVNNTCTRKEQEEGYECNVDEDCPDFTYFCDTDDHKCKGGMSIGENEKCKYIKDSFDYDLYYEIGNYFYIASTLQCKPGLVCVENVTRGSSGQVCKKAHSQKDHLNYCNDDDDCPYDAKCQCDSRIGLSVCVPIPSSSKKLKEVYENYYESVDRELALYEYLIDNHLYFSADFRCDKYLADFKSGASAVKASVIMTAILALFAFFF